MEVALYRRYLIPLLILSALVFSARPVRVAQADANNPDVIPTFVDSLNRGDMNSAMQVASQNLKLTLPNGLSVPITASTPLPAALLPITILSLTPEGMGTQTVDGVFTFGSDPTQQRVQIRGDGGVIVFIAILGP
jgi:hypothetical protein